MEDLDSFEDLSLTPRVTLSFLNLLSQDNSVIHTSLPVLHVEHMQIRFKRC